MKAKEFIPPSKPRNFVVKNQKTAGAGAHKDKKRAEKQGDVKHKQKQFEQGVAEGSTDLVQIEYWQQETMESGRWVKTKPIPRATAEKIVNSFERGEIVDVEQGVAKGPQDDPEDYRAHLLKTLPRMMNFLSKNVKGWKPTEEQYLAAIETGYEVMKHTGDVKQAGQAMTDELNTLHRMSQNKSGMMEVFADQGSGSTARDNAEYMKRRNAAGSEIKIPTEDGITMQDIRLMAGEGPLTKKTVLQAIAVIRKQRRPQGVAEGSGDAASATPAKNERGRFTAWDDDEPMRLKCEDGEFRTIQEINMLRQKIGMKPFSIKSQQGVAEGKSLQDYAEAGVCPICHGDMVSEDQLEEGKKDACYHKIKASSKVWPSAYASGRLVQCRKAGAANYGKGKKK